MRSSLRWCLAICVVTAAALGLPAAAMADGTITKVGSELRFVSGSQDAENLVITRQTAGFECTPVNPPPPGSTPCIQFGNGPQLVTDNAAGCVQVIATVVACTFPGVTRIVLDMRDGDDFVSLGDQIPPVSISGGSGDDNLSSDDGTDDMDGGEGDDLLSPGSGDEVVTGGPGVDTVVLENGDDTVRLDGLANDGVAGETKNIASDNEIVDGGGGGDLLFGDAGANTLVGGGGNDLLDGGPGADVLIGGAGADDMSGGAGVDLVQYPGTAAQGVTLDDVRDDGEAGELDNVHSDIENVDLGPGDDAVTGNAAANALIGGDGNDLLDGGGGADAFAGGPGDDVLLARDGLAETLDCGPGVDTGAGDTIDALVGCEGVVLTPDLVPDADGDGVAKPADCNDLDPAIRPGVVDIPGNAVDEDCLDGPAPFPPIGSTVGVTFRFGPAFTQFTRLTIRRVRAGSQLRLQCRGRGCPFRSRTRTRGLRRDRAERNIARPLRRARLKPGARFVVRLTAPGTVGVFLRFRVRAGKPPVRRERCLPPGATAPVRCAG